MLEWHDIELSTSTTMNLQGNSTIEQIHQAIDKVVGDARRFSCTTWILCKRIWKRSRSVWKRNVKVDVQDTKCNLVSPDLAMFCTHLFHFGTAVQLLPGGAFSRRHVLKICTRPSSVCTTCGCQTRVHARGLKLDPPSIRLFGSLSTTGLNQTAKWSPPPVLSKLRVCHLTLISM